MADEHRPCSCGRPERLPDGPYRGTLLCSVGERLLLRLTDHERAHAGKDLFCLSGETNWVPAEFFGTLARQCRDRADLLTSAHAELVACSASTESSR